jgi:hypothetical protein
MDDHKISRDNKVSKGADKKTQLYKHWVRYDDDDIIHTMDE